MSQRIEVKSEVKSALKSALKSAVASVADPGRALRCFKSSGSSPFIIYCGAILLSAFLLFQVQPMISRMILPWFGGIPAVWTTAMLFFQVILFLGYHHEKTRR